jgi:hypothetical protein
MFKALVLRFFIGIYFLVIIFSFLCLFVSFLRYWGINSEPCIYQVGSLPFEPCPRLFLYFSCFLGRILCFYLGLALEYSPATYCLLHSWDHRHMPPPHLVDWDGGGSLELFLGWLNCYSPYLYLLSSWDYKGEPLFLASHNIFLKEDDRVSTRRSTIYRKPLMYLVKS